MVHRDTVITGKKWRYKRRYIKRPSTVYRHVSTGETEMALTELKVKAAKPQPKPYKLADERGMYLYVYPAGGKLRRMDYRFDGKRKTLAIGA